MRPPKPKRGPAVAPMVPPKMVLPKAIRDRAEGRMIACSAPAQFHSLGTATPTTGGGESPRSGSEEAEEEEEYPEEYGLACQEENECDDPMDQGELQFEFTLDGADMDVDMGDAQDFVDDFVVATVSDVPRGSVGSLVQPGSLAPSSFHDRVGSLPGDSGYGASPVLATCLASMFSP